MWRQVCFTLRFRRCSTACIRPSELFDQKVRLSLLRDDLWQRETLVRLDRLWEEIQVHETKLGVYLQELQQWEKKVKERQEMERLKFEQRNRITQFVLKIASAVSKPAPVNPNLPFPDLPRPVAPVPPQGVYLCGDVGVGKSMVMDLLFETLRNRITRCLRVHSHHFLMRVHQLMYQYSLLAEEERSRLAVHNPLTSAAFTLIGNGKPSELCGLLCFDEFQLNDVGDASILTGLLDQLLKAGICVVFTSNRPPDQVNRNLLQRRDFTQFLQFLSSTCQYIRIGGELDYRKEAEKIVVTEKVPPIVFFTPITATSQQRFEELFEEIVDHNGGKSQLTPCSVPLMFGRTFEMPQSVQGVGRTSFQALCAEPCSAVDYVGIAQRFHTLFVTDVPQMSMQVRDQARRFITLIDELYNHHVRLICTSDVAVSHLFDGAAYDSDAILQAVEGVQYEGAVAKSGVGLAVDQSRTTLFTGEDEIFAFRRAVSRLIEMQSPAYLVCCVAKHTTLSSASHAVIT